MKQHHFVIISLPAQGHINPTLQLAKNLTRATGARCTFITTINGFRKLKNLPSVEGLFYDSFSDGHDDAMHKKDFCEYLLDLKCMGSESLKKLFHKFRDEGRPVTSIFYTLLFTWVVDVAREFNLSYAFLAIQSATVFAIYHNLFTINNAVYSVTSNTEPSFPIKLPGLPLFLRSEIPTFLLEDDPSHNFMIHVMREHIQTLENDPNPMILINSFDALEKNSMKLLEKIGICSIGPLLPSAFCDGSDVNDKSFGCELFDKSENYSQWLDSKDEGSVVYISFGSFAVFNEEQKEEILQGLLESERPFLWVVRSSNEDGDEKKNENIELNGKGMIVPWCSQMEVLFHKSIGCFVSHCGWNSTLESTTAGVPLIGYPQFADQLTNIKMVEEVWRTGVKARAEEGTVKKEELKRCLEIIMGDGEKGKEIRGNAKKYRDLAMEAVKVGGSSHNNFNKFLESL